MENNIDLQELLLKLSQGDESVIDKITETLLPLAHQTVRKTIKGSTRLVPFEDDLLAEAALTVFEFVIKHLGKPLGSLNSFEKKLSGAIGDVSSG